MKSRNFYTAIVVCFTTLSSYNIFWLIKNMVDARINLSLNPFAFLQYLPGLLSVVGGMLFLASKFRRSSLLRICMGYTIFSYPLVILSQYYYVYTQIDPIAHNTNELVYYLGLIIGTLRFIISCLGLRYITRLRVLKTYFNRDFDPPVLEFLPVKPGKRFANWMVDSVVISFLLGINIENNYYLRESMLRYRFESEFNLYVLRLSFLIIYYLVFEGIFKTTPGKCATNTILVNESGADISFGQAIGRTIYRLIPLEFFTFLGKSGRGLHDTITRTYVADTIFYGDKTEYANELSDGDGKDYLNEFYQSHHPYHS